MVNFGNWHVGCIFAIMTTGEWIILGAVTFFGILILKKITMTNEEAVAKIDAQEVKITKIQTEIQGLKDAILSGGNVSPEIEAALARVDAALQATDDMNEDAQQ